MLTKSYTFDVLSNCPRCSNLKKKQKALCEKYLKNNYSAYADP